MPMPETNVRKRVIWRFIVFLLEMVKRSKCALCGATRSAYKGFKTPAVGIDAAVKIQDLGTSRWQLRIVFFTPAPVHPKGEGAPMTAIGPTLRYAAMHHLAAYRGTAVGSSGRDGEALRAERRPCPRCSHIHLFGYGEGIINLDTEIAYGVRAIGLHNAQLLTY
jgi:hypothetical protein